MYFLYLLIFSLYLWPYIKGMFVYIIDLSLAVVAFDAKKKKKSEITEENYV